MRRLLGFFLAAIATLILFGCNAPTETEDTVLSEGSAGETAKTIESNPLRNAYFGDLHVHTTWSFDAFMFGNRTTPDDAYRFAKGDTILHPSGREMSLPQPLDFQSVTDHAIYMGMMRAMFDPESSVASHPMSVSLRQARSAAELREGFLSMVDLLRGPRDQDDLDNPQVHREAWARIVEAAERHNDPGSFTTFVGYEYTSAAGNMENLHRNVIFRGSEVPEAPYSAHMSINPEDLWDWMDEQRAMGRDVLAIPHNSNGSDGWMFRLTDFSGEPFTPEYADQRMRNEPLVENTQVKGTSDTHPSLSPNDEWADFEIMSVKVATDEPSQPSGSYVREALVNGLVLEETQGFNPFKFGVIGSSDSHVSAGSFEEDNYWAKIGLLDATPELRGSVPLAEPTEESGMFAATRNSEYGASGLAVAWAESNTRDAIFDAFRRKETYSTSGPRMLLRFFAGYGFPEDIVSRPDGVEQADQLGVPMGADLSANGSEVPSFIVWTTRDAGSAPLQRLQIVKGWVEDGEPREEVYDIACSDGLSPDLETNRCPDNGASVDLSTCDISADLGAASLSARWADPGFDASQRALYYVRVLENPTCRWSTWDAIRNGTPPRPDLHATIQERAWSSPIWYMPAQEG